MALVRTMPVGPLGCNMVLIADPVTLDAVLVDPGGDSEDIIQLLRETGAKVKQIVITHAHVDHILAAEQMRIHTGATVMYNENDRQLWLSLPLQCVFLGVPQPKSRVGLPDAVLHDGDHLAVREGLVLHTPGHTMGSTCFYFPQDNLLCSGDTLFREGVGRTDLPGGSPLQLMNSIRDKLLVLPDATRVVTGHGEETTIGYERYNNPYLSS